MMIKLATILLGIVHIQAFDLPGIPKVFGEKGLLGDIVNKAKDGVDTLTSPVINQNLTYLASELDIDLPQLTKLVPSLGLDVIYDPLVNYSDTIKFPGYGTEWMFMPDGEGKPVKINFLNVATGQLPNFLKPNKYEEKLTYRLYTKSNKVDGEPIKIGDDLDKTLFDRKKETKIITHGWLSSGTSKSCVTIKDAYVEYHDYNVIILDWNPIAKSIIYPIPMLQVSPIAKVYALFIDYLISKGTDPDKIHLIGHSLGAHLSGLAGKNTQKKLKRVTGLDPALPGFRIIAGFTGNRLGKDSAQFVDVIHSCAGILGIDASLGHADFYPNNGLPPQPGCSLKEYFEGCSHARSWKLFGESVNPENLFEGISCSKSSLFRNCKDSMALMGDPTPSNASGNYYLQTLKETPFALKRLSFN